MKDNVKTSAKYVGTVKLLNNRNYLKTKLNAYRIAKERVERSSIGIMAIYKEQGKASPETPILTKEMKLEKFNIMIDKLENTLSRLDLALKVLDEDESELIELRYFEGYRNWEIAKKMDFSDQTISRKHKCAILKLSSILFVDSDDLNQDWIKDLESLLDYCK